MTHSAIDHCLTRCCVALAVLADEDDVGTFRSEAKGDGMADASSGASDEGNTAGESLFNRHGKKVAQEGRGFQEPGA